MEKQNIKIIIEQLESMENAFDDLRDNTNQIIKCLTDELNDIKI